MPGCKAGDCPSYETVLPKVKAYHEQIGVPFRHWQFDSWFYPKDGSVATGGGGGAVTNWTADPKIFPRGMAHIQSELQLPLVMHNRQWSTESDYIRPPAADSRVQASRVSASSAVMLGVLQGSP